MKLQSNLKRARGLSLIELMVSLVLGLLLVAGIIQLFTGSRVTYMSAEGMARVQENGRFALEFLRSPMRTAGTHGFCAGRVNIHNHLNNPEHTPYDERLAIAGWEYDGTTPGATLNITELTPPDDDGAWSAANFDDNPLVFPDELTGRVVPGTDVLFVRRMELIPGLVADVGANEQGTPVIDTAGEKTGVGLGEIILVTDCNNADIFQNTTNENNSSLNASGGNVDPGNDFDGWRSRRDESMQILRARSELYYIGFNADRGEPGLYRFGISDGSGARHEELVSGVENMQLLFGYSRPGSEGGDGQSVDWWLPADLVPDWSLVIAAKVGLSVRSPESTGPESVQRSFGLVCDHGGDCSQINFQVDENHLRHPFSTTISLRNRGMVD